MYFVSYYLLSAFSLRLFLCFSTDVDGSPSNMPVNGRWGGGGLWIDIYSLTDHPVNLFSSQVLIYLEVQVKLLPQNTTSAPG